MPEPPMDAERRAACARAVHVYTADQTWIRAGRAWLFALERCGWPITARFLRRPPMIWVLELGYKVVANNRPVFARYLFRGYSSEKVPTAYTDGSTAESSDSSQTSS